MQAIDKVIFVSVLILATQLTRIIPVIFEQRLGRLIKDEALKGIVNDVLFFFLICYCFRDLSFDNEYYLRLCVALYVFLVQLKFEKTLLSIFSGTLIYMVGRYLI